MDTLERLNCVPVLLALRLEGHLEGRRSLIGGGPRRFHLVLSLERVTLRSSETHAQRLDLHGRLRVDAVGLLRRGRGRHRRVNVSGHAWTHRWRERHRVGARSKSPALRAAGTAPECGRAAADIVRNGARREELLKDGILALALLLLVELERCRLELLAQLARTAGPVLHLVELGEQRTLLLRSHSHTLLQRAHLLLKARDLALPRVWHHTSLQLVHHRCHRALLPQRPALLCQLVRVLLQLRLPRVEALDLVVNFRRAAHCSERCAAIDADALHWRRRWLQLLRRILLLLTLLLLLLLEPRRRVESLLLSHVLGKGLLSRL